MGRGKKRASRGAKGNHAVSDNGETTRVDVAKLALCRKHIESFSITEGPLSQQFGMMALQMMLAGAPMPQIVVMGQQADRFEKQQEREYKERALAARFGGKVIDVSPSQPPTVSGSKALRALKAIA